VSSARPGAAAFPPATATPAASATIAATIIAAAIILVWPVVAAAIGVVLRWVVTRRKILGRRGVRIGLPLFGHFHVLIFYRRVCDRVVIFLMFCASGSAGFLA